MDTLVGRVVHYYNHLNVAVVELEGQVRIGDTLTFLGHTTDFTQILCSIEKEHRHIQRADPGTLVAIKVDEPVRIGDQVYKIPGAADQPEFHALWDAMLKAEEAIVHLYSHEISEFADDHGIEENSIGVIVAALTFEPASTTPERLQVRGPYTSRGEWMRRLHDVGGKGLLVEPEPGEFRLTAEGRLAIEKAITKSRKTMAAGDPLEKTDGARLASLLERLVQASLFTAPPPDTWSIRLAYTLMPSPKPPLPYIEQAISCLRGYRDDAHLAAWRPSGLSGPSMEALTLVWRGEAAGLERIYEKLARRGFEQHDYQREIADLRKRGLVKGPDRALVLTPAGQVFRDQVEQDTDRFFFQPWSCLEKIEAAELSCLLMDLKTGLQVPA